MCVNYSAGKEPSTYFEKTDTTLNFELLGNEHSSYELRVIWTKGQLDYIEGLC